LITTGNTGDNSNTSLNGKWKNSTDEVTFFPSGIIMYDSKDYGLGKGMFSTSGSSITFSPTHYWRDIFDRGYIWYSKKDFEDWGVGTVEERDEWFKPKEGTYSINGNTLTLTIENLITDTLFTKQ